MQFAISQETAARRVLLVDDDEIFSHVAKRALEKRGYAVSVARDATTALQQAQQIAPEHVLLDLRMPDGSGLALIEPILRLAPTARIVVLTGYASIATAVEAIKLGAMHYLTKPVDVDDIVDAFNREKGDATTEVAEKPLSINRLEWEHMQKVLLDCNGNISAAARRMSMHRRTLQRKLKKHPARQ